MRYQSLFERKKKNEAGRDKKDDGEICAHFEKEKKKTK